MGRDGSANRGAILDAAEQLVLDRGFAGAGVDRVIAAAGTTKGGFFHHFASKKELAEALIERWAAGDQRHLDGKMSRAEELVDDPLDQLLVFVGLFIEEADEYAGEIPGCLFASFSYQAAQFDEPVHRILADSMLRWRRRLRAKLEEACAAHPPRAEVDLDALADSVNVVFEGAYVVSRAVRDGTVVAAQLRLLRTQLRLLFGVHPADS